MDSDRLRFFVLLGVVVLLLAGWLFMGGDDSASDGEESDHIKVIANLEKQGDAEAVAKISKYTKDRDIRVARRSIQALGRIRGQKTDERIKLAFEDKRYEVREAAVVALGYRIDKPANVAALREKLADPREDINVRIAAAPALVGARDWDALNPLIDLLNHPKERARRIAVGSIYQILDRNYDHMYQPGSNFPESKRLAFMKFLRDFANSSQLKKENDKYKAYIKNKKGN